mmetsp:Transcript_13102/g.10474  ORF Transcript_13102/g.10474 Transcript_13102/m.10474 type:complete len:91 (+) Transcript_13102:1-273(+)
MPLRSEGVRSHFGSRAWPLKRPGPGPVGRNGSERCQGHAAGRGGDRGVGSGIGARGSAAASHRRNVIDSLLKARMVGVALVVGHGKSDGF